MSKGKILVVDDEPDISNLIKFTLERRGYKIILAKNGQDAMNIAKKEQPKLILLDVIMPVINGYEVCRLLKECAETKDIPVIMLSGKTQKTEIEHGLKVGANNYICKPFSPKEFANTIEEIFSKN
ncbi:response regulator [Candidatus Oleimmundimicrobium sp.]|uniref:response regulator n=1 Tax=Candidatus Oleimmundimicrobium sp. TaxID=3060597 RepID=UPI0027162A10|nr:response regulator [Candidatus Oleimmundimicrobium sp.]MDO8885394.1 response regulator [Candidatus Oleimmundimicrobium sp.]